MKFLCLHGAGTNSRIFELQTSALRNEIGGDHTYEFVEGAVGCEMFPTVEALSTPNERYFKYYEEGSVDSYSKAVADMDRYIELEGPFDAVLAFSQGSSVAAGFLMKTQSQGRVHFGCAIFIAGLVSPYDDSRVAAGAEKNAARGRDGGQRISMPTTHIWGASEENPAIPRELYERCVSEASSMLVFEGGHEVPGAKNNKALLDSTRLIRGMISLVQDGGMKDAT